MVVFFNFLSHSISFIPCTMLAFSCCENVRSCFFVTRGVMVIEADDDFYRLLNLPDSLFFKREFMLFNLIDVFFFDRTVYLIFLLRLAIALANPFLVSLMVPGVAGAEMASVGEVVAASTDVLVMVVIDATLRELSYPGQNTVLRFLGLLMMDVLEDFVF